MAPEPRSGIAVASTAPLTGHPRGLYTLFLTEMWERFSYYGMRALLVLFMVDSVNGGLRMSDEVATAIYGLYTAGVYLAALPGGWVADRFLGAQRSVWYGGLVIAAGQFTLALSPGAMFYIGLLLVVLGTGLLKPNVSAIVGELYPEGGARRDAGFTIFYMGINLGAALGPVVSSALGEKLSWRYGFMAAGLGMVLGLVQYRLAAKNLGSAGLLPGHREGVRRKDRVLLFGALGVLLVGLFLGWILRIHIDPVSLARGTTYLIVGVALLYFVAAFLFFGLDRTEKNRLAVIAALFAASAVFWSGFEQAGSSLNLFAERYTQRVVLGFELPAGWFQSLGPAFIISLAPVMASLWIALARRNLDPSLPVKFAWGLLLLGLGFLVMVGGASVAASGYKAWPTWLILTFLIHSLGELCVSPVGLSSVTKLAPRRLVGQMMGIWFLATSLGNLIAGLVAGGVSGQAANQMTARYLQVSCATSGIGLVLILCARPIKRLMAGVK